MGARAGTASERWREKRTSRPSGKPHAADRSLRRLAVERSVPARELHSPRTGRGHDPAPLSWNVTRVRMRMNSTRGKRARMKRVVRVNAAVKTCRRCDRPRTQLDRNLPTRAHHEHEAGWDKRSEQQRGQQKRGDDSSSRTLPCEWERHGAELYSRRRAVRHPQKTVCCGTTSATTCPSA
jgi:hypothetical protein